MGVLGAAVVGFVVGIAFALLLDEYLGFEGGLWDTLTILIGLGGAFVAVRLVHLMSRPRRPGSHHHHRHA
jgi:uncharacterized membrane protein YeaQ/YmgE (transglycosylase-associated protein family)